MQTGLFLTKYCRQCSILNNATGFDRIYIACGYTDVKPLVEAYFAWIHEQDPACILSEKAREDLKYSLKQEKYLKVFLEDGNIPIDNPATERATRPFTIGRANWHIMDTVHGTEVSATVYTAW